MPSVFVSATSRDLRSYRRVVAEWARERGYTVVVQDDFPVQCDHASIVRMLTERIAPCDAVVHLAGLYYGFEPTDRPDAVPRRSYTQLEYDLGKELKRQVFRFVAREDYAPDQPIEQEADRAELQRRHRERLTSGDQLYYEFSTPDELRRLLDALEIRPTISRPQNLPFRSIGSLFKGRDAFLARLRDVLVTKPTHVAAVTAKHAIHGLGGVGKTRLAIEYGWRFAQEYTALLFVTADSPSGLDRGLADLCAVLGLPERDARELPVQTAAATRWLRDHAGWFLILDNVDTPEAESAVEALLRDLDSGHVVLTSRLADWSGVEALPLDVLDPEAARDFLLERTADKRRTTPDDAAEALALAADVDGLALALEQAAAFVVKHRLRFADYRARWREQEAKVLEWYDPHAMKYPKSVAVTWQTSLDRMSDDGRRLLNVLCWLSPDPIPRGLIEKLTTEDGEPAIDVETGLADLTTYSLAKWGDNAESVVVHRLVEEITRYRLPKDERVSWLTRAVRMVNDFLEYDPSDVRSWPGVYDPCQNHLAAIVRRADAYGITASTARLMNLLAIYLHTRGDYAEAERVMRRELAIEEEQFGNDHPNVAVALGNLASLLHATGRLADAEPLVRRALAISERFGSGDPGVAAALDNLAQWLIGTGRLAEAEPLFRRALAISEQNFGSSHPTVAIRLNNLGQWLRAAGRLDEAEPLLRRALAILDGCLGGDHSGVAVALNNLAMLLCATGRLAEAEPLQRRALAIDERTLGSSHPNVAVRLSNLGQLLKAAGRLAEAEPLQRRALAIDERAFGSSHPNVALRLVNLAKLLQDTNRLREAESLLRRGVVLFLRFRIHTGFPHPHRDAVVEGYRLLLDRMEVPAEEIEQRLRQCEDEARHDDA